MRAIAALALIPMIGGCQWLGGEDYVDQRDNSVVYAEWCNEPGCFTFSACADDKERQQIAAPPRNKLRQAQDARRMPLRYYNRSAFYRCADSGKDT